MSPGIRYNPAYGLPEGMFPLSVPYGGLKRPSRTLMEFTVILSLILSSYGVVDSVPRLRHMLVVWRRNKARLGTRRRAVPVSEVIYQDLYETTTLLVEARSSSANGQVSLPINGVVSDADLCASYLAKVEEILSTIQDPRLYVVKQYRAALANITTGNRDLLQLSGDVIMDHVARYMRGVT